MTNSAESRYCYIVGPDDDHHSSIAGVYSSLDLAKAAVEKSVAEDPSKCLFTWSWLSENDERKWVYLDELFFVAPAGRIDRILMDPETLWDTEERIVERR